MGQIHALCKDTVDAEHRLQAITQPTLEDLIKMHLDQEIHYRRPRYIAQKALDCLKKRYDDQLCENFEVLISLQDVETIAITSGNGRYKVLVFGDLDNCQTVIVEYQMSTTVITGLFLDSLLSHCRTTMPLYLRKEFESQSFEDKFTLVKQFVEQKTSVDWENATIDFNGMFPLTLKSGNGTNAYTFDQITTEIELLELLEQSKQEQQKHKQDIHEITLEKFDARELGKIRINYCGNEGSEKDKDKEQLEELFVALIDYYKQHENKSYWNKSVIKILNGRHVLKLYIGTKTKGTEVIVMFKDGAPNVTVH